ncbi:hypothetical protein ABK040_015525 [Willaertia magna]
MKNIITFLLVSIVIFSFFAVAEEEKAASTLDFNVANVLQGEWNVELLTIDNENYQADPSSVIPTKGTYNFTYSPLHEGLLLGTFEENQEGSSDEIDVSDLIKLLVQSESEQSGTFKIIRRKKVEEEEQDELSDVTELQKDDFVLFDLSYNFLPSTTSKQIIASQGKFTAQNGTVSGTYEFIFTTKESFILSFIYDTQSSTAFKVDRIVGFKSVNREMGFFQKYGPTLMIGVFFLTSRLLTGRMAGGQGGAEQPAATGGQ